MPQPTRVRSVFLLICLLLGVAVGANGAGVTAQGGGWECVASAVTVAATPVADAASPATRASAAEFPEDGGELTVFAAASLTDAFGQIEADLEAAHPDLAITFSFAGSQALVTQMTEGATADVFASANNAQMTAAAEAGLIAGEPVTFIQNRLAIVVPADNPAGIAVPADLGQPGLRLVLAQAEVPVGTYSRQAVCSLADDAATVGEDFVARVAANVVSEEEDVRDVLAKVQLGEADAGIVYVSDAFVAADEVQIVEIPIAANVLATYPIAAVSDGDAGLAAAFIAYLLSPEGQATLADFGFTPLP